MPVFLPLVRPFFRPFFRLVLSGLPCLMWGLLLAPIAQARELSPSPSSSLLLDLPPLTGKALINLPSSKLSTSDLSHNAKALSSTLVSAQTWRSLTLPVFMALTKPERAGYPQNHAFVEDDETLGFLQEMVDSASPYSGRSVPIRLVALQNREINAAASAGSLVFLNTGLVQAADTSSELYAVLAHEMGHLYYLHSFRHKGPDEQPVANVLSWLLAAGAPALGVISALAELQSNQLAYSRAFEQEADRHALSVMRKEHRDPSAISQMFSKLAEMPSVPAFLLTHPSPRNRQTMLDASIIAGQPFFASKQREQTRFELIQIRLDSSLASQAALQSTEQTFKRLWKKQRKTGQAIGIKPIYRYLHALILADKGCHIKGAASSKALPWQALGLLKKRYALLPEIQTLQARLLACQGKRAKAILGLRNYLELNPDSYAVKALLGRLLLKKHPGQAVPYLASLAVGHPQMLPLWDLLYQGAYRTRDPFYLPLATAYRAMLSPIDQTALFESSVKAATKAAGSNPLHQKALAPLLAQLPLTPEAFLPPVSSWPPLEAKPTDSKR